MGGYPVLSLPHGLLDDGPAQLPAHLSLLESQVVYPASVRSGAMIIEPPEFVFLFNHFDMPLHISDLNLKHLDVLGSLNVYASVVRLKTGRYLRIRLGAG